MSRIPASNIVRKILGADGLSHLAQYIVTSRASDTFGASFVYGCSIGEIHFFIKMAPYLTLSHNLWKPPRAPKYAIVDAEIAMMRAIKNDIIRAGYTPHYAELLAAVHHSGISARITETERARCDQVHLARAERGVTPQAALCAFEGLHKGRIATDEFALIFSEQCDEPLIEHLTFHDPIFASDRAEQIMSFIFQIYWTLAVTTRVWPNFRHGDLFMRNIMTIAIREPEHAHSRAPQYLQYKIDDRVFNVPFFGGIAKIIDFGHGQIPDIGIISSHEIPLAEWVPDHVTFIADICQLIFARPRVQSSMPRAFLDAINPENITSRVRMSVLLEHAASIPTPEQAIAKGIFGAFETTVPDSAIIRKYIAPPVAQ